MNARFWLAAGAISLMIGLLWILTPVQVVGYDGSFYQAMTQSPFSGSPRTLTAPYAFRVLPSWLLALAPGQTLAVYTIYNALVSLVTALISLDLLRRLGFDALEAGVAVFIFLSSWVNLRFSFYNPIHVDTTYYLILVLAFHSLVSGHPLIFWGCLVAGAATREYFVSLLLVHYLYHRRPGNCWDGAALKRTLLIGLFPLFIFIMIRVLVPVVNPDFNYPEHLRYFGRMFIIHWPRMLHSFFNVFGVGAGSIGLPACLRYAGKRPWLTAYLLCSLVFLAVGGSDRCRIIFTSWPAILIFIAVAIRARRPVYRSISVLVLIGLLQALLMRWHLPLTPENYRRYWWSNISFLPREEFLKGTRRMILAGLAFTAIISGKSLFLRSRQRNS